MIVEAIKRQASILSLGKTKQTNKKTAGLYGERTFFISSQPLYHPGATILYHPLLVIATLLKSPLGQI